MSRLSKEREAYFRSLKHPEDHVDDLVAELDAVRAELAESKAAFEFVCAKQSLHSVNVMATVREISTLRESNAVLRSKLDAVRSELDEARRERDALKFGLDLPDTDPYARRIIGHDASMCPLCGYVVCPALLSKKEHLP